MSYSFNVTNKTKGGASLDVASALADVVEGQPIHKLDQPVAQATADRAIGLLADDPAKEIVISVSGYLGWLNDGAEQSITTANVSVTASLQAPEAAS